MQAVECAGVRKLSALFQAKEIALTKASRELEADLQQEIAELKSQHHARVWHHSNSQGCDD